MHDESNEHYSYALHVNYGLHEGSTKALYSNEPKCLPNQTNALNRLVCGDNKDCHDQLRVNRHIFMRLRHLLEENGLQKSGRVF